jgi:hypothetical protein
VTLICKYAAAFRAKLNTPLIKTSFSNFLITGCVRLKAAASHNSPTLYSGYVTELVTTRLEAGTYPNCARVPEPPLPSPSLCSTPAPAPLTTCRLDSGSGGAQLCSQLACRSSWAWGIWSRGARVAEVGRWPKGWGGIWVGLRLFRYKRDNQSRNSLSFRDKV